MDALQKFIKHKNSKKDMEDRIKKMEREWREEFYVLEKEAQKVCPHKNKKFCEDPSYHGSMGDDWYECVDCRKYLGKA